MTEVFSARAFLKSKAILRKWKQVKCELLYPDGVVVWKKEQSVGCYDLTRIATVTRASAKEINTQAGVGVRISLQDGSVVLLAMSEASTDECVALCNTMLLARDRPPPFGSTIEVLLQQQQNKYPDIEVPITLHRLCQATLAKGAEKSEGVFRVPGDLTQMKLFRAYACMGKWDWLEHVALDEVAGLLKMWLRELPSTLIPDYKSVETTSKEGLLKIYDSLTKANRAVCLYISTYLKRLAAPDTVELTKMSMSNLCMVFAPSFLRAPDAQTSSINSELERKFVQNLVDAVYERDGGYDVVRAALAHMGQAYLLGAFREAKIGDSVLPGLTMEDLRAVKEQGLRSRHEFLRYDGIVKLQAAKSAGAPGGVRPKPGSGASPSPSPSPPAPPSALSLGTVAVVAAAPGKQRRKRRRTRPAAAREAPSPETRQREEMLLARENVEAESVPSISQGRSRAAGSTTKKETPRLEAASARAGEHGREHRLEEAVPLVEGSGKKVVGAAPSGERNVPSEEGSEGSEDDGLFGDVKHLSSGNCPDSLGIDLTRSALRSEKSFFDEDPLARPVVVQERATSEALAAEDEELLARYSWNKGVYEERDKVLEQELNELRGSRDTRPASPIFHDGAWALDNSYDGKQGSATRYVGSTPFDRLQAGYSTRRRYTSTPTTTPSVRKASYDAKNYLSAMDNAHARRRIDPSESSYHQYHP